MDWYKKSSDEVIKELNSNIDEGLSSVQAKERLEKFGLNELERSSKKPFLKKLLDQFKDPMVIILIIAAIISAITGEVVEMILIFSIVIVNAIMSIIQEGKAEDSVEALQKMSSPDAKVVRNGDTQTVKSSELVPGDIVILETGDIVPADIRLIESSNLKIDESSFTGESVAVEKNANIVFNTDREIGDRDNYAYSSTIVTYGRGIGIVTTTGVNTEIGKIAQTISSFEDVTTPLQMKLNKLSKQIGTMVIVISIIVYILGLFSGLSWITNLITAVSLGVAAIPEGMTAVVTIVLSLGMNRMAGRNAIVKKLLAVETLGTTTVICSDKTGTLTQNEMTVTKIFSGNSEFSVSGTGYSSEGDIIGEKNKSFDLLIQIAALVNDAKIVKEDNNFKCIGDPTEGALVTLANKSGLDVVDIRNKNPRLDEIPFDSDRKLMSTFHRINNKIYSFTKGAPDILISRSTKILLDDGIYDFTEDLKKKVLEYNSKFARQALRCLAYAYREFDKLPPKEELTTDSIENNMIFVGLTGMIDPPRLEAKAAIAECDSAGIRTVMITGDYLDTAFAIGKDLGIVTDESQAMMGKELNNMTDEEISNVVKRVRVFARVSPENKVQIVEAFKRNGEIVAMTGDGVNDAPAIKRADIGLAMGITGTDVAKNTSDVILTDDNFATIVHAVEEGRTIYSNIKKFVSFLLSCNVGEVIVIAGAMLIHLIFSLLNISDFPVPLTPVMLLWLNLVTDSFPALAIGIEPGEKDNMNKPPRAVNEPVIDRVMRNSIIVQSIAIAVSTLVAFAVGYYVFGNGLEGAEKIAEGRTMAFSTLILAELLRSFAVRSDKYTVSQLGIMTNKSLIKSFILGVVLLLVVLYIPMLRPLFEVSFMTAKEWIPTIILALVPFTAAELHKVIKKK